MSFRILFAVMVKINVDVVNGVFVSEGAANIVVILAMRLLVKISSTIGAAVLARYPQCE